MPLFHQRISSQLASPGGALGSLLAQFLKLTADERKTLLVAGLGADLC